MPPRNKFGAQRGPWPDHDWKGWWGDALRQAKEAANGKDVRLGGGVATVREFLDADLVDTVPSPSGVTHLLFWRR